MNLNKNLFMYQVFHELEKRINNKQINIKSKYLTDILQNFKIFCLSEENFENIICQRKSFPTIITIDFYKDTKKENQNDYLIFCFDNSIIISSLFYESKIKLFISYYSASTFYCVSQSAINFFEKKYYDIQVNYSIKNLHKFIKIELINFVDEILHINDKIDEKLLKIIFCISGYLLLKSYQKSNSNRFNLFIKNNILNSSNNKLSINKYITINNLNNFSSLIKVVYNIEDEKLYVIKIFLDNEKSKLFERELENYKNLNHPFIPHLYEYCNKLSKQYLVIEYINGETLDKFDLSKLTENEIMNIIFEIMIVIHYLHSNNYIYRDLKPNNIIINENNTAILIDFDRLIKIDDNDENIEFTLDFSHEYISPEIKKGQTFTNKTDIYSLGLLITNIFINGHCNIRKNYKSKLLIMCKYCVSENPNNRPSISELIRYFYLNILIHNDSKQQTENELIKILQFNCEKNELNDPEGFCTLGIIFQQGIYTNKNIDLAIKYYIKASNQNNLLSKNNLFTIYHSKNFIQNEGIKYIKQAADQNDPFAQFKLGVSLFFFSNSEYYQNEGIKLLKLSADQKFICAQSQLGLIYYMTKKNINDAIKYFSLALKYQKPKESPKNDFYNYHGNYSLPNDEFIISYKLPFLWSKILSNFYLGIIYYLGHSVQRDVVRSIDYFIQVSKSKIITLKEFFAENNIIEKYVSDIYTMEVYINILTIIYSQANDILGEIFMVGSKVTRNIDKAIQYFKKSAKYDDLIAQYYLGIIYSCKEFNHINISEAIKYYSLIYRKKYNTYYNKGMDFLLFKSSLMPFGFQSMIKELSNGINITISDIQNNIGDIYNNGEFINRDLNKAIQFYKYASDLNNSEAQLSLGIIYIEGDIKIDIDKSIFYLSLSAKSNNADAQFLLGFIYFYAFHVPKNINKGISYLFMAAENHSKFAHFYLGVIYLFGPYIKQDIYLSIHHFKEASNLNHSYSKNNLGVIYKIGYKIQKNISLSIEYFNEAILINNDEVARYNLSHIYFYDENIDKAIELLVNPSLINLDFGFQLLCLAIIKKCQLLTVYSIENEISKYNLKNKKLISYNIYNYIFSKELCNLYKFQELYENLKTKELFYSSLDKYIPLSIIEIIDYLKYQSEISDIKKKNIDHNFFEGFGIK